MIDFRNMTPAEANAAGRRLIRDTVAASETEARARTLGSAAGKKVSEMTPAERDNFERAHGLRRSRPWAFYERGEAA